MSLHGYHYDFSIVDLQRSVAFHGLPTLCQINVRIGVRVIFIAVEKLISNKNECLFVFKVKLYLIL